MPLPVSRRAERFAAALDGDPSIDDAATQRLVGTTARLGALQVAGPVRTAAGRAALVAAATGVLAEAAKHAAAPAVHAAASTAATGATTTAPAAVAQVVGHAVAVKVITGVIALAVIGGGVEAAAQRSLPDQPFYGLKRATEAAQLHLSGGAAAQAKQRLDQAKTRLAEIKALWPERDSSAHSQQIADLMTALDQDVALATGPLLRAGGSAAAELSATVNELQTELAALPDTLAGRGAGAVATSISMLGSLTAAVTGLATLVPGVGPSSVFPAVPTVPVQVAPLLSGPAALGGTTATAPRVSPQPTTPPSGLLPTAPTGSLPSGVLPSVPSGVLPSGVLPSGVLPSGVLPSVSVPRIVPSLPLPPVVSSALPAPVVSAVCSLLHGIGCPS